MFNLPSKFLFLFFSFFQTYRSQLNVFTWCEWGISHLVWLPYYRKLTCISKLCVFPRRVNFHKPYFRRHWLSGMFFRDLKFPSIWLNFRFTCKVLDMPKKAKSFILSASISETVKNPRSGAADIFAWPPLVHLGKIPWTKFPFRMIRFSLIVSDVSTSLVSLWRWL